MPAVWCSTVDRHRHADGVRPWICSGSLRLQQHDADGLGLELRSACHRASWGRCHNRFSGHGPRRRPRLWPGLRTPASVLRCPAVLQLRLSPLACLDDSDGTGSAITEFAAATDDGLPSGCLSMDQSQGLDHGRGRQRDLLSAGQSLDERVRDCARLSGPGHRVEHALDSRRAWSAPPVASPALVRGVNIVLATSLLASIAPETARLLSRLH